MIVDLRAEPDIHGRRANLSLTWTALPARPRLRLVRRLFTYPSHAYDGVGILDLAGSGSPAGQQAQAARTTVIALEEEQDSASGEWRGQTRLADGDLTPEQIYYYQVFAADEATGDFYSQPVWRTMCMPTGRYGLGERVYHLLPAVHRNLDDPSQGGQNQLQHLLEVFGASLDALRSEAEGLRSRHDVLTARADLLPHLARLIGWEVDQTQAPIVQRLHILAAPGMYDTIGTVPNVQALVNMYTGWDSRVKEFGRFIAHSASGETGRAWQIWEQVFTAPDGWSLPLPATYGEGFDGRPAAAKDDQGRVHLFWHSNRDGRWRIWERVEAPVPGSSGITWGPQQQVTLPEGDCCEPATVAGGGLWLFWASSSAGSWDIWCRQPGGAVEQVTAQHPGDDRYPAVVYAAGRIWLFWSSTRRGPSDIWWTTRSNDGAWEPPARLTTAQRADTMPVAAVDASGRIWLCWSAYLGDRSNLFGSVYDGSRWSEPMPLTAGLQRDEAPALAIWQEKLHLFWQSDRPAESNPVRRWRIWHAVWDPAASLIEPGSVADHWLPDQEPAVLSDGVRLRLFRRWQQHATRTVDTGDPEARQYLGTFQDTTAYTYDCGRPDGQGGYVRDNSVRYDRQTIGVFIVPDLEVEPFQFERDWEWISKALAQFLPVHVRAVYVLQLTATETYPTSQVQEHLSGVLIAPVAEVVDPAQDHSADRVPGWRWFFSNDLAHRAVNTQVQPIDTRSRTWHTGLDPESDLWS